MLRPSRPMIRPFMSSVGMWTVLTVVSAVWSAALRWMAVARIRLDRSSPIRWPGTRCRAHAAIPGPGPLPRSRGWASGGPRQLTAAADVLERRQLLRPQDGHLGLLGLELGDSLLGLRLSSLEGLRLAVQALDRSSRRRSWRWKSARRSRASSSAARCAWRTSSLPSRMISFCWARASATSRSAYDSAVRILVAVRTRRPGTRGSRPRGRQSPARRARPWCQASAPPSQELRGKRQAHSRAHG